jgi:hypothetical protein
VAKPASFSLVFGLLIALAACGSNDSKKPTGSAGSGWRATAGSGAGGSGGSAGGASLGTRQPGDPCNNTEQCATGENCVISFLLNDNVQICAKSCASDDDCDNGQTCVSETDKPADAHCVTTATDAFAACGPSMTTICQSPLDCIPSGLTDDNSGFCYNYCILPNATMTVTDASVLKDCPNGLTCSPLGDADVGVCSMTGATGDTCGLDIGKLCSDTDVCITELSDDGGIGDSNCYRDCTTVSSACPSGTTCMVVDPSDPSQGSFCL